MRQIDTIIVHCSATEHVDDSVDSDVIRAWHVEENGWSDIGYHFVITRRGDIEFGRPLEKRGAHARGHNDHSVGVCLVGGLDASGKPTEGIEHYTLDQMKALTQVIKSTCADFGDIKILGHRDLPRVFKACPCFDVAQALKGGFI